MTLKWIPFAEKEPQRAQDILLLHTSGQTCRGFCGNEGRVYVVEQYDGEGLASIEDAGDFTHCKPMPASKA